VGTAFVVAIDRQRPASVQEGSVLTPTAAETGRRGPATPAAIHDLAQFLRELLAWRQRRLRRLLRRGDQARDDGDFKAAAALYRQALGFDARRSDIRVQLGHMLKELARYDEAEAAYRQALAQSPEGDTHLQLGHLLKLLGRRDEAIAAYTVAYRQLDENDAAAVELRALGAAVPGEEPHVLAEEHIALGDRLRDRGRYADAARAYAHALELVSDRTDIRVQYGNMLKDSGQLSQAEAAYRIALSSVPDSAEIHLQLGHVFKTQGRRDEALAEYRRASEIQPSLDTAWKELALAGSLEGQQQQFEMQLAHGGVEALIAVAEEIRRLQNSVLRIAESLPGLSGQMAFPVSAYHRLRELYDVPEPPWTDGNLSFGIVLAADGVPSETLYDQITSISAQSYRQWRLAIVSSDGGQRQLVERAAASDPRILWTEGIAGETSDIAERRIALGLTADRLVLPAPGARLHRHALAWYAAAFGQSSAAAFIADQDGTSEYGGGPARLMPQLRQTLDYDTLLETNPFGDTIAIEGASYAAIADRLVTGSLAAARSSLLLELSAQGRVGHLPLPLVRSDADNRIGPSLAAAAQAHAAAVRGHVAASGLDDRISIAPAGGTGPLRVSWLPRLPHEPVQVIIPTRDNGSDVREFVDSLRQTAAVPDQLRVLIVDNGSRRPETRRTLAALSARDWIRVVSMDEPFNWSRLNNRAAELSDAEVLVFANDDMVMLGEGWDAQLRGLLERPEIGAVGARLLYPDDTVQHAGILLGWPTGAVHDGRYEPASRAGPCGRWHVSHAVSAVTGAFLAVRREAFAAAGGFDEVGLPIAYGDVDFALRLRARGLKILWTPTITLRHYESKSRGLDHLDPEKRARNEAERRVIEERWGEALRVDPSINPFWHPATLPFRLISAPSEERLWRHIRLCAASNPWLPAEARDVKNAAYSGRLRTYFFGGE
jgi:tetratricopeptide (TPR) repeat protein/GT2 family glycosyltransferase